jgi:uncharacterized coiled-coil protein SlyX
MNSQIRFVSSAWLALFVLAGCATVEPVEPVADPRIDQLVAGVDQCLANQVRAGEQLQNQAQQLQLQLQQLQAMDEQLKAAGEERAETPPPAAVPCPKPPKASNQQTVGYLERVWLPDLEFALTARIDTGVLTGVLYARNIEQFERDGKRWVKFDVPNPATGEPRTLEQKLRRTLASASGDDATRHPVVKLGIVVGRLNQTAEFVLYDRSYKTYQLKIGRSILRDVMLVDVSKKNIAPYTRPDKPDSGEGAAQ